jgi:hypothetical protein
VGARSLRVFVCLFPLLEHIGESGVIQGYWNLEAIEQMVVLVMVTARGGGYEITNCVVWVYKPKKAPLSLI